MYVLLTQLAVMKTLGLRSGPWSFGFKHHQRRLEPDLTPSAVTGPHGQGGCRQLFLKWTHGWSSTHVPWWC